MPDSCNVSWTIETVKLQVDNIILSNTGQTDLFGKQIISRQNAVNLNKIIQVW